MQHAHHSVLPKIEIKQADLRIIVVQVISAFGNSFDFNGLLNSVTKAILKNLEKFIKVKDHVRYTSLNKTDQARVREIVWDFIILRYITIGDEIHDSWPFLSLTEHGKDFFHTEELSNTPV